MAPLSRRFVTRIEDFAAREGIDLIVFRKGHRKDDVAKEYLENFRGGEGVLFSGKAQEKATTILREAKLEAALLDEATNALAMRVGNPTTV